MNLEIFFRFSCERFGGGLLLESWILRTSVKEKDGRGLSTFKC